MSKFTINIKQCNKSTEYGNASYQDSIGNIQHKGSQSLELSLLDSNISLVGAPNQTNTEQKIPNFLKENRDRKKAEDA
jgi:hypothetical protein